MPETKRKADYYNDDQHNYLRYWDKRDYENGAEELAIKRLLAGKHFKKAVDVGGGYGRLAVLLESYADKVVLTDPSERQLDIAKDFLKDHGEIDRRVMQADSLDFADNSVDLVTMIRVMHHLPDPTRELAEIARVLSPSGYAIIEVANYMHFVNRLRHLVKGKRIPSEPVDIRSAEHQADKNTIAFVNHNPNTVRKQLGEAGLRVERVLSVSNLRSTSLKKIMPKSAMLAIEGILQPRLSKMYFGPSIFFLVKKA